MNLKVVKTDIARKIAGTCSAVCSPFEIVFRRDGNDGLITLLTELIT